MISPVELSVVDCASWLSLMMGLDRFSIGRKLGAAIRRIK